MIYDQLSKTFYTQKMIVFESLIIMDINEDLWNIFTFPYFNSRDINWERLIFV